MKELFAYFLASFDNSNLGASARKLTAFALMFCIGYIHFKYVNEANAIEALIIDLSGVLVALGIITMQNVIELKNGAKGN